MSEPTTRTIKVRVSTYRTLRLIAALTGETLQDVCERVMQAELAEVQARESRRSETPPAEPENRS